MNINEVIEAHHEALKMGKVAKYLVLSEDVLRSLSTQAVAVALPNGGHTPVSVETFMGAQVVVVHGSGIMMPGYAP